MIKTNFFQKNFHPRRKATTLIELLITSSMILVVSIVIFSSLSTGLEVWSYVRKSREVEDVNILFDKFSPDLRNTFVFDGVNLIGTEQRIEFPTIVKSPLMGIESVGKVVYYYDPNNECLKREQLDYSQIYTNRDVKSVQVINKIKELRFLYYYYEKATGEYLWLDDWSKEGLPLAVRLEIEYGDRKISNKFTKTISIPASG